jgi:hypothetical protein
MLDNSLKQLLVKILILIILYILFLGSVFWILYVPKEERWNCTDVISFGKDVPPAVRKECRKKGKKK